MSVYGKISGSIPLVGIPLLLFWTCFGFVYLIFASFYQLLVIFAQFAFQQGVISVRTAGKVCTFSNTLQHNQAQDHTTVHCLGTPRPSFYTNAVLSGTLVSSSIK